MNSTVSDWQPRLGLLRTELKGAVTVDDVRIWREGLLREEARIPDGSRFVLLVDLHGFDPSLDAHKAMRTVIPELLARHGMRPAFIDLFDEKPEMPVGLDRRVRCVAFANVHHDETKMANYRARIGRMDQQFFTDVNQAIVWLRGAPGSLPIG